MERRYGRLRCPYFKRAPHGVRPDSNTGYGRDLTYSNKALDIVDKHFLKIGHSVLEIATSICIINSDLQMLIEKNIAKQNSRQLKKEIASYQKQIEAHTAKISSPALYVPDWDSYTEKH